MQSCHERPPVRFNWVITRFEAILGHQGDNKPWSGRICESLMTQLERSHAYNLHLLVKRIFCAPLRRFDGVPDIVLVIFSVHFTTLSHRIQQWRTPFWYLFCFCVLCCNVSFQWTPLEALVYHRLSLWLFEQLFTTKIVFYLTLGLKQSIKC